MSKVKFPKDVKRFPRLAEVVKGKETEHITVLASLLRHMASHHKSRLEMGRELCQLKRTVKHGHWEAFYADKFRGATTSPWVRRSDT